MSAYFLAKIIQEWNVSKLPKVTGLPICVLMIFLCQYWHSQTRSDSWFVIRGSKTIRT